MTACLAMCCQYGTVLPHVVRRVRPVRRKCRGHSSGGRGRSLEKNLHALHSLHIITVERLPLFVLGRRDFESHGRPVVGSLWPLPGFLKIYPLSPSTHTLPFCCIPGPEGEGA